nr:MAG TPA: hypothetical protein [Caudoviricetes sp.]
MLTKFKITIFVCFLLAGFKDSSYLCIVIKKHTYKACFEVTQKTCQSINGFGSRCRDGRVKTQRRLRHCAMLSGLHDTTNAKRCMRVDVSPKGCG